MIEPCVVVAAKPVVVLRNEGRLARLRDDLRKAHRSSGVGKHMTRCFQGVKELDSHVIDTL
jgi:hypothetical protein